MKGSCVRGAISLLCLGRLLWPLFVCGYLLEGALCQTHLALHLDAHQWPFSVGGVSVGVEFALTAGAGSWAGEGPEGRVQDSLECPARHGGGQHKS